MVGLVVEPSAHKMWFPATLWGLLQAQHGGTVGGVKCRLRRHFSACRNLVLPTANHLFLLLKSRLLLTLAACLPAFSLPFQTAANNGRSKKKKLTLR